MTVRTIIVFILAVVVGGPLSFIWYLFEESYWWIPMAFVAWVAAIVLPEWDERRTSPYRPHRHYRRRR